MDANQREQLRLSLLRNLGVNPTTYGTPVSFLRALAAAEGRPHLSVAEVEAELLYLQDAGLVTLVCKQISPENASFRISKQGRDFLAERGIA